MQVICDICDGIGTILFVKVGEDEISGYTALEIDIAKWHSDESIAE